MERMQYTPVLILLLFVASLEIIDAGFTKTPKKPKTKLLDTVPPSPFGNKRVRRGSYNGPARQTSAVYSRPEPNKAGPSVQRSLTFPPSAAAPNPNQQVAPTQSPMPQILDLNLGTREYINKQIHARIKGTRTSLSGTPQDITLEEICQMNKNRNNALLGAMELCAKTSSGKIQFSALTGLLRQKRLLTAGLQLLEPRGGEWNKSNLNLIIPNRAGEGLKQDLLTESQGAPLTTSNLVDYLFKHDSSFQSG